MSEKKKADAYCPDCEAYIVNERVTFEECCDACGAKIEWHGGFDRPTTTTTTPTPFITYLREVRDSTHIDSKQWDAINGAMHEIDDRVASETALRAENERLGKRDCSASVELVCPTKDNPFAREALQIVDVGVSDNVYIVESKTVTELQAENDRLKHYQYNCAEMERVNTRNDELKFQLGKKYREVDRLKVELAQNPLANGCRTIVDFDRMLLKIANMSSSAAIKALVNSPNNEAKTFSFQQLEHTISGKPVFKVMTVKNPVAVGIISFYGEGYVFTPNPDIIWTSGALAEVSKFMEGMRV